MRRLRVFWLGLHCATSLLHPLMHTHPQFGTELRHAFTDPLVWRARLVFLGAAALAGWVVVAFTQLCEWALAQFFALAQAAPWAVLLWAPASAAAIVWTTRRWVAGAAGSGIPQVMAAQHEAMDAAARSWYVSLRLALIKVILTAWGLLAGLSLGREGPSVQVAAGVMLSVQRWLPARSGIDTASLLVAGGAAGIAAAFNTPLGGIMFAIEELARHDARRNHSLLITAIVLAGLIGVSAHGNQSYFGTIAHASLSLALVAPGLLLVLVCGLSGGLFARVLIESITGRSNDWFSRQRAAHPVRFAAGCALAVAVIGLVTHGATFGTGYSHTRSALAGQVDITPVYALLKWVATWLTTWSGVPAGIFAPSLAIGAGVGETLAQALHVSRSPELIAWGMAAFLAAATQAPLTAFIIVMEMVDGHSLVLSLMAAALAAAAISRLVSRPLYASLADYLLLRLQLKPSATDHAATPTPSSEQPGPHASTA